MVLPALYNGPLNYFARLVRQQKIVLEQFDSYSKQTYRNRCRIMGPNRVLTLSIPVKRERGTKSVFRDIRIDYDTSWNKVHWRSLVASYAASPFFEYLADELHPFYHKKFKFLVDLNIQLIEQIHLTMGLDIPVVLSESFTPLLSEKDPRQFIHPKKDQAAADPGFIPEEYHQVFSDRLGFQPNLSILDLIFNEGPEAHSYLNRCLRI